MSHEAITTDPAKIVPVRRVTDEQMIEAIPAIMANRCPWCGMPMSGNWCDGCFPPSKPSREAVLKQAIINVAARKSFIGSATSYLRALTECYAISQGIGGFAPDVRAEFNRLVTLCP